MIGALRPHAQARVLVPEVIQASAMDCGPAALQALAQGFGLTASYGRLREACQTSVDGTSISTMDEIARVLGLDTEEILVPHDHLLLRGAKTLPAIVVTEQPGGGQHFVVVWSSIGPWVQVMDPAEGRQWMTRPQLIDRLYRHRARIPASTWRQWSEGPELAHALAARLTDLGIDAGAQARLISAAHAREGWRPIAALDAAVRMTAAAVSRGGVNKGGEAVRLIEALAASACDDDKPRGVDGFCQDSLIAAEFRGAWRAKEQGEGEEILMMRGAVVVRASGRLEQSASASASASASPLTASLTAPETKAGETLLHLLSADGLTAPISLAFALCAAAALLMVDAVLLRGLLELGSLLGLPSQRAAALAAILGFLALGLAFDAPMTAAGLRLGRALDLRLRLAFLTKLPRLDDRYFRSRLLSDMAERGHSLHLIRQLPQLGIRLLRAVAQLVLTVAGIAWIDPASAPWAAAMAALCLIVPLACQPLLAERELRLRSLGGALGRFYLDALLGLVPIKVHGARVAMVRQQGALLARWRDAGLHFQSAVALSEGALALAGVILTALLVHAAAAHTTSGLLLLVYWALGLPALGQEIALVARQYPSLRNVVLRLLEPLTSPESGHAGTASLGASNHATDESPTTPASNPGVAIALRDVSVVAGGNRVLESVSLDISPGEHLAIVGPSGAGKSSLVGLLLGWMSPSQGQLLVDDQPLEGEHLDRLRRQAAWVDPSVALWNRSFLDNLRYGSPPGEALPLGELLAKARLREVLERMPDGLATPLGEGGGRVSGGEGQRTRLGRALARRAARLVILDEPFRGLDLTARQELLATVRAWWQGATLLLVTHDLAETADFSRVLVIEDGRLVEDGAPARLLGDQTSRYAELVRSAEDVRNREWAGPSWRRLWLRDKRVQEEEVAS